MIDWVAKGLVSAMKPTSSKPERARPVPLEPKPEKPAKPAGMDFSKGSFKDRKMFNDKLFSYDVRKQLGTNLPAAERRAIGNALKSSRDHGSITKGEVKRELRNLRDEGKLTNTQMKIARRKLKTF